MINQTIVQALVDGRLFRAAVCFFLTLVIGSKAFAEDRCPTEHSVYDPYGVYRYYDGSPFIPEEYKAPLATEYYRVKLFSRATDPWFCAVITPKMVELTSASHPSSDPTALGFEISSRGINPEIQIDLVKTLTYQRITPSTNQSIEIILTVGSAPVFPQPINVSIWTIQAGLLADKLYGLIRADKYPTIITNKLFPTYSKETITTHVHTAAVLRRIVNVHRPPSSQYPIVREVLLLDTKRADGFVIPLYERVYTVANPKLLDGHEGSVAQIR